MTDWISLLLSYCDAISWQGAAPGLMLASFFVLMLTGYPVAFILGALAVGFAAAGIQAGSIAPTLLAAMPGEIINGLLLNSSLIAIPMLVLFVEIAISSGMMARTSHAIKGLFDADIYRPLAPSSKSKRSARQQDKEKERVKREENRQRSIAMALLLPAAMMLILIAHQFALPADYLVLTMLVPVAVLVGFYCLNWLADLWTEAFAKGLRRTEADSLHARPWLRILMALVVPLMLILLALGLLLIWKLSLFAILAILCLLLFLLTALQLSMPPTLLLAILNRSALASASLFAIVIMAAFFIKIFMAIGGAHQLAALAAFLEQGSGGMSAELLFISLLLIFMALGLLLDWMIMALLILPLAMPLFAHLDFAARLAGLWHGSDAGTHLHEFATPLIMQNFSLAVRLWLASLIWFSLLTALVTFSRQNGEILQKELVQWTGKIKDSPASLGLFVVLQIIGLVAITIVPQLVLWLPSVLIR
nr:hypothetical protein [uncultured Cohaesibacter sp.]